MIGSLLESAAHRPATVTTGSASDVVYLEARLDALELACSGLWTLLKTKHGYSDDELVAAVQAVDLRDGQLDGKVKPGPVLCPTCGRQTLTRSRIRCLWCGTPLNAPPL